MFLRLLLAHSEYIMEYIRLHVSIATVPRAKLLGFYIGPAAGSKMWNGVIAKYNNRILEMKSCHAPLAINCLTYKSRISFVFSYIYQLVPWPKFSEEQIGIFSVL